MRVLSPPYLIIMRNTHSFSYLYQEYVDWSLSQTVMRINIYSGPNEPTYTWAVLRGNGNWLKPCFAWICR